MYFYICIYLYVIYVYIYIYVCYLKSWGGGGTYLQHFRCQSRLCALTSTIAMIVQQSGELENVVTERKPGSGRDRRTSLLSRSVRYGTPRINPGNFKQQVGRSFDVA